jgi:hypothetical protein
LNRFARGVPATHPAFGYAGVVSRYCRTAAFRVANPDQRPGSLRTTRFKYHQCGRAGAIAQPSVSQESGRFPANC